MVDSFSPYPIMDDTMVSNLGYVADPVEFSYMDNYEEFPLKAENEEGFSQAIKVKITDPRCTWDPETHNLSAYRKCRLTSPYALFGEGGICASTATLGIALRWISTQSDERGIIPFGELTKRDSSSEYEVTASFDKGKLKGSLKLQTILYLKDAGTPTQSELYFAQQPGTVLGTLDSYEAYIDGNGSIFPISVVNEPGKPLWTVYYNESADPLQDRFSDENVEIRLNEAHANYASLKIESSMVESPLFIEVLASALMVIVESAKDSIGEDWDTVLIGEGFETGSIAEAIYYFVSKLGWDISSPSKLSVSIREFFENGR